MRKMRRFERVLLLNREGCNLAEIAAGLKITEGKVCAALERFGQACWGVSAGPTSGPAAIRPPDDSLALLSLMNGLWEPAPDVRAIL